MARKYPRFAFFQPTDGKSTGAFVIHLLQPRLICEVVKQYPNGKQEPPFYKIALLDVFTHPTTQEKVEEVLKQAQKWLSAQVINNAIEIR